MHKNHTSLINLSRGLTLTGYFGLLIFIPIWYLKIEPIAAEFISMTLLIQVGPLMFPLKGILHGRVYTHAWSMYLALFYFICGVWYAGDISSRGFGLGVIIFSVLFFIGAMLYTRFQGQLEKAMLAEQTMDSEKNTEQADTPTGQADK